MFHKFDLNKNKKIFIMINSNDYKVFLSEIKNLSFEQDINFESETNTYKDYLNSENYGSSRSVDVSTISECIQFYFNDSLSDKYSFLQEQTYGSFYLKVIDSDGNIYFDINFIDLEINGQTINLTEEIQNDLSNHFIDLFCDVNGWDKTKAI